MLLFPHRFPIFAETIFCYKMKIEHLAIWAGDLELLRRFYMKYFDAECSEKYVNDSKKFSSYFLTFGKGGTRIELMHTPDIENRTEKGDRRGLAHFAISVGGKEIVDSLTEKLREDEYPILGNPRHTGDGYYESIVSDPEGNCIEITI